MTCIKKAGNQQAFCSPHTKDNKWWGEGVCRFVASIGSLELDILGRRFMT
jgi:hypothetical protein